MGFVGMDDAMAIVAAFASELRIDRGSDPVDAKVALGLFELRGDIVGVVVEDLSLGTIQGELPVVGEEGQIGTTRVANVNWQGFGPSQNIGNTSGSIHR